MLRCGSEVRTVRLTVAADRAKTLEGLNLAPTLVATTAGRAGVGEITGAYTGAGLAVAGLAAGTRAAETGLAVGDVVVGFGGEPLRTGNSPALLYETVKTLPPGTELNLDVIRVASVPLSVTLGGRPVDRMNEQDLMVARMQFADWWRAETGEQSIVRDPIRMMWPVPPNQVPAAAAGPAVLP